MQIYALLFKDDTFAVLSAAFCQRKTQIN